MHTCFTIYMYMYNVHVARWYNVHVCTCVCVREHIIVTPRTPATEDQSAETVMQQMDQHYAPLHLVSMVTKHGTAQQLSNAKDSDLLTKERLCRALSMFEVVLKRLKDILMKDRDVSTYCTVYTYIIYIYNIMYTLLYMRVHVYVHVYTCIHG